MYSNASWDYWLKEGRVEAHGTYLSDDHQDRLDKKSKFEVVPDVPR